MLTSNRLNQFEAEDSVTFLPRDTIRRAQYCYGTSSVRDVKVSWSQRLEICENNFMVS